MQLAARTVIFLWLAIFSAAASLVAEERAAEDFVIRETLGQRWRNECVFFELSAGQLAHANSKMALVGPDEVAVPYQIVSGGEKGSARIAFAVGLDPFEVARYRFSPAAKKPNATDLQIVEQDERIDLLNAETGISLRRKLAGDQGPIQGIRLPTDGWIGESQLKSAMPPAGYALEITSRGPVFAEAVGRVKFGPEKTWTFTIRLQAAEPAIVIDEQFSTGDDAAFRLDLAADYPADYLFYRAGNNIVGRNRFWQMQPDDQNPVFVLEPWLHWWERDRQGNWFGLFSSKGDTLVSLGALKPGLWIDPAQPADVRSAAQIFVTREDDHLWATFPLRGGQRSWLIGALRQDPALELPEPPSNGRGPGISNAATLPQHSVIKHGDFPLDRIKDVTALWPDKPADALRPLVSDERLQELRRKFQPDPDYLHKIRHAPVDEHAMDDAFAYYLLTGDAELGQHLAEEAVRLLQGQVDNFCRQNHGPTLGVEPHRRANGLLPAVNLAALMLESRHLSDEETQRLKSQLAFLADTVTRPDFYSPARGYSANPNMTSTVSAFQVRIAGAIPSHPKSPGWIAGGMNELKRELMAWSDANGGWLEAPHYAMVAYDTLLGCFLSAHLAGQDEVLFDPRMQKVAEWLAKISTPPDPRLNGWRHLPPIGNTYQQEPSSVFGHLAVLWRQKDPQFAASMQWMHQQQGFPRAPGIGGFFPTLAGYRSLLLDDEAPAAAPQWTSELFPEAGVVLRNGFPSKHETQLYLIAGRLHDHYDDDSGSFTLWGKGSLLSNDFGYVGHSPADEHNLVISPQSRRGNMRIEQFATTESLDSFRGVRDGWTRQIAFVKEADPLGRNYFVIADKLSKPDALTWRLWLTADNVDVQQNQALATGRDNVDLDVFFATPAELELRTEDRSRNCLAMLPNRVITGSNIVQQTGLIAELKQGDRITAVLYPRLKTDPAVEIASLADGKVTRLRDKSGDDYVFLDAEPFAFEEGDISFEGTVGLIQVRGKKLRLALGADGKIAARGRLFADNEAGEKTWELPE